MSDETVSGELPPEGDAITAADLTIAMDQVLEANDAEPQIDAVEPEVTDAEEQQTEPVAQETETQTAAPPEADTQFYRKAFEQKEQEYARLNQLVAQLLQERSAMQTGAPAQSGPSSFANPAQGQSGSVSPQPVLTPAMLAEKLYMPPDDPLVQGLSQLGQSQAVIPELIADLRQRQVDQTNWNNFQAWAMQFCPVEQRPKDEFEMQRMYFELAKVKQDHALEGFARYDTLLALRQASKTTPKAVEQAKQDGYQQGLKKNARLDAANATSVKPQARKVAPVGPRSIDECWNEAVKEAASR